MANQNALTAAHIRYLLVLLRLTAANGHTRCVDLAAALELSPPSVHNMVDTMTALGLVKKGTRGADLPAAGAGAGRKPGGAV